MQSVTSNAVYNALGMSGWTKVTTFTGGGYIEYKKIGNDTVLHIRFNAYMSGQTVAIGVSVYQLPTSLIPSETKRGMCVIDIPLGRVACDVDVNTNGTVCLYPAFTNQYTGNFAIGNGVYGDCFYVIN